MTTLFFKSKSTLLSLLTGVTVLLTGCSLQMATSDQAALANSGTTTNYIKSEYTLNIPYATIKTRLQQAASKCGSVSYDQTVINKNMGIINDYQLLEGKTPNSFVIINTDASTHTPEKTYTRVRMEFSKVDANTTHALSHHYYIPLLSGSSYNRDRILEWAEGEHDFCD